MSFWKIILPLATTNLVTNPSFETATTGWTAVGGSIASNTTYNKWGARCLAVTPTSGTGDGVYFGTVSLTSGTTYTFSVWIKGVAAIPYKIYFADTSATLKGTAATHTGTGGWVRVTVSWACDSTTTYRLYAIKDNHASTGVFYIDGAMCEAQTAASTYCDGDQAGCTWNAAAHASASTRSGQSRAGGQIVDPADYGFYVRAAPGIGMPPILQNSTRRALLPGSQFNGTHTESRVFVLEAEQIGSTWADLHLKRKNLINAIKPDAVGEEQPFILRYSGTGVDVDTPVVYDTGLGFATPEGFTEIQSIRLIGYDPFWYEVGEQGVSLTVSASFTASWSAKRVAGVWSGLGTLNGDVLALAIGPDGYLYAGGAFTTAGGVTVNYVGKYDGSAWTALGSTAGTNGTVYALAFGPDGSLYAGGDFTQAGGGTVHYVAKWNGSTWADVGSGANVLDAAVYALAFGRDGMLYAGGAFTTYGIVSYCYYAAKWNGTIWDPIEASGEGFSAAVWCLAAGLDGTIYFGGDFTTNHATDETYNYVAKYASGGISALSTGLAGGSTACKALAIGDDGALYVGGVFTSAGGVTAANIAKWNGAAFSALGSGTNGAVRRLLGYSGNLLVFGSFTTAGGIAVVNYSAVWNGFTWSHLDAVLHDGAYAMINKGDDLYLGLDSSGTTYSSYQNTVTNSGTRSAYPVIKIKRAGGTSASVRYLKNETSGLILWLNYSLLDGETLTIDLREGMRAVRSDFFGDVWSALLRNSDLAKWSLLPGTNLINAFVYGVGSPTVTAEMVWKVTHWSADGPAA